VIDDDLPSVVGVLEDEGEETFDVASVFFASFNVVFADDDGEVFIERVNFKVGVGEGAHGCFAGVVVFVLLDEASEAAKDLMGDEEGIGRVFESTGECDEVSFVPGVLLSDEDLDDVEFLAGGGVEWVGRLLRVNGRCHKGEEESGEAEGGTKGHGDLGGEFGLFDGTANGTYVSSSRIDIGLIVADRETWRETKGQTRRQGYPECSSCVRCGDALECEV
jgi:hypothetical protein